MTPNEIDVLVHYHCKGDPHPRINAIAVKGAVEMFIKIGILEPNGVNHYDLTERGAKLLKMLCETPFPEKKWVDPREQFQTTTFKNLIKMDYLETEKRVFAQLYGKLEEKEEVEEEVEEEVVDEH